MAIGNVIFSRKPLTREDVVDNLNSTVANLPLSARQGMVLDEKMEKQFLATWVDERPETDINNFKEPGVVHNLFIKNVKNAPPISSNYFYLLVLSYQYGNNPITTCKQVAFDYTGGDVVTRYCFNGNWSKWTKLVTKENSQWQLIGSVAGGTALNFDTTKYTEFLVRVYKYGRALMSVNVLSQELPTNRGLSAYIFQNNNICIKVECAKTYFQITQMFENNAIIDIIPDTVTLTVYGK